MSNERRFDQDLAQRKEVLLRRAGLAEQSVARSLKALVDRDDLLAKKVDIEDNDLDQLQVETDDRCIEMLALRQPPARDLRFIMMATRINTDLECIGDHATNIAEDIVYLYEARDIRHQNAA